MFPTKISYFFIEKNKIQSTYNTSKPVENLRYNEFSGPNISYFFTYTMIGRGSERKSVITFSESKNNKILDYIVISGNAYHKKSNDFIRKILNSLISVAREKELANLNILIPAILPNKDLIRNSLFNYNIRLIPYKRQGLMLNESIHKIREAILKRRKNGKITVSSVKKLIDILNKDKDKEEFKIIPINLPINVNTFQDKVLNILNQKRGYSTKKSPTQKWLQYIDSRETAVLTPDLLGMALNDFCEYYKKKHGLREFAILFKLKMRSGEVRSLSTAQIGTEEDLKDNMMLFANFAGIFLGAKVRHKTSDDNREDVITREYRGNIIFDYKPLNIPVSSKIEEYPSNDDKGRKVYESLEPLSDSNLNEYQIPQTMDLKEWPNIIFFEGNRGGISTIHLRKDDFGIDISLMIVMNKDHHEVKATCRGKLIFSFKDTQNGVDLNTFTREITYADKNKTSETFIFDNGKVILHTKIKKVLFMRNKIKDTRVNVNYIMTLDLETRRVNNKLIPICLSIYDGKKATSFLFKDHNNWDLGMYDSLRSLITVKYHYKKIYIHNLSYFDGIFILDTLAKLGHLDVTMKDGKIIKLKLTSRYTDPITGKVSKIILFFYDSLLILPASLDNLSNSFNIENKKSIFPFEFINSDKFSFDYSGDVPEYKYFPNAFTSKFTPNDYNNYCEEYKSKNWVLKKELTKYCENDTVALYQIITKFAGEVFDLYSLDITKYPTLPSITMAAYRINYLPPNTVPLIGSRLHYTLKQAYYGGITDTYRPRGENILSYDVNSLYPFSMHEYEMPIGNPVKFVGNPTCIDNNPFGFFKVKVTTPLKINVPILPTKIKTSGGLRTICPVGSWTGWYFSEEIRNAEKYGYKFEIIEGYLFKKRKLFPAFIGKLYKIKSSLNSSDPRYMIAKLFMNSLYGRFGMNPINEVSEIVPENESEIIVKTKKNVKVIPLLSGYVLVNYEKENPENPSSSTENISVPIAAAITAYSRIVMTYYLNKYRDNIYAVDTDGIKVDLKLSPSEVDNKILGKMKFEYKFKKAIFPAPKVYSGILEKPYKGQSEITKVKGVKIPLSYHQIESVLYRQSPLEIIQEKWKRLLNDSSIIINLESYTLALSESKRELIFNSWGELVGTIPLFLENGIVVKRNPPTLYYLPAPDKLLCLPSPKQLLCIPTPVSYLPPKIPREEENTIYTFPRVLYTEPPLPSVIYLPGKIQERLTAPSILAALPPPEAGNLTKAKVLCEEPALPKVIYIDPSLANIIYLPGKIYVRRGLHNNLFKIIGLFLVLLVFITYFCLDYSMVSSLLFNQAPVENQNVMASQVNEVLETEIEYLTSSDLDYNKIDEENQSDLNKLSSHSSGWWKYKSVFIGLGIIAFSLALWYWINRSADSSSGGSIDNSSMPIGQHYSAENTPTFDDIPSITYEDRGFVRRIVRDSFFEDTELSARLRDRTEDLALEALNLNTRAVSREEMIQIIHESDVSPNTAIDAVQSLLREAARELNTESPPIPNALIPYNSVTDLVVYNPENIPIPATVDMGRYEVFIQYLDHYNAIIAAYGF